jgi:CRISPR-associated exonuclease Cas4
MLLTGGLVLLILAVALGVLLWNERYVRREHFLSERHRALGLPSGELVYEDADGQGEPLASGIYPLVGKPDYVVQLRDGRPVPIEVKLKVHDVTAPYSNHILQVAAYCLILEDYFTVPPTHGILRYADREFTIEYTQLLRKKVIRQLTQMALCSEQETPQLAKQKPVKCRACTFQVICPIGRQVDPKAE